MLYVIYTLLLSDLGMLICYILLLLSDICISLQGNSSRVSAYQYT